MSCISEASVPSLHFDQRVAAIRGFNRFYTRRIGILNESVYRSPFSLTEARVLYEVAHRKKLTATDLGKDLGVDAGYLSRMLRGFEKRGLVARTPAPDDGRQNLLTLTRNGRAAFAPLDARSRTEIGALLSTIPEPEQNRLINAMRT